MPRKDDSSDDEVSVKTINNVKVKPMKIKTVETLPVLGAELFPTDYCNVFICARKKSGKTVVIQNILKRKVGKNTTVIIFCSTANLDQNWIAIQKWLKKHNVPHEIFYNIKEGKVEYLKQIVDQLKKESHEHKLGDSEDEEEEEHYSKGGKKPTNYFRRGGNVSGFSMRNTSPETDSDRSDLDSDSEEEAFSDKDTTKSKVFSGGKSSKVEKLPYCAPDIIFVFDDMSSELKNKWLIEMLKEHRHFKSLALVSSQYPKDCRPESVKMCDYFLLFGGHDDKMLEKFLGDGGLPIKFETFKRIYKHATKEPYNFLYISNRDGDLRKNFDTKYIIREKKDDKEKEIIKSDDEDSD